jgi:hypothetical protein
MPLSLRLGLRLEAGNRESPRKSPLQRMLEVHSVFRSRLQHSRLCSRRHFPAVHPNDWSSNEQHQEKRRKKPSVSPFPPQNTSTRPNSEPNGGGSSPEEPVNSGPTKNESMAIQLNLFSTSGRAFKVDPRLRFLCSLNHGSGNGGCATLYGVISQSGGPRWIMQR